MSEQATVASRLRWLKAWAEAHMVRAAVMTIALLCWWTVLSWPVWSLLQRTAHRPYGGYLLFALAGAFMVYRILRRQTRAHYYMPEARYAAANRVLQCAAPRSDVELNSTARHEAAHAVTAWALGCEVLRIDLLQVEDRPGRALYLSPQNVPEADQLWATLVPTLAGNVIDLKVHRHDSGSWRDILNAERLAAGIISTGQKPSQAPEVDLTSDALLAAARASAVAVLAANAGVIDATTKLLLADQTRPWIYPDLAAVAALAECGSEVPAERPIVSASFRESASGL